MSLFETQDTETAQIADINELNRVVKIPWSHYFAAFGNSDRPVGEAIRVVTRANDQLWADDRGSSREPFLRLFLTQDEGVIWENGVSVDNSSGTGSKPPSMSNEVTLYITRAAEEWRLCPAGGGEVPSVNISGDRYGS